MTGYSLPHGRRGGLGLRNRVQDHYRWDLHAVVFHTYLTAVVPAGATAGFVSVATPGGTLKSNRKFLVAPSIVSFAPTSGPVGTPVTVTGVSFTGAKKVTFAGVSAAFTVDSDTQ